MFQNLCGDGRVDSHSSICGGLEMQVKCVVSTHFCVGEENAGEKFIRHVVVAWVDTWLLLAVVESAGFPMVMRE